MTVGSIIEGAFRLLKERPGAFLIWTLVYLAIAIGTSFAMAAIFDGQIEAAGAGASEPSLAWSLLRQIVLLNIVTLMVVMVVYTATLRAVLRPHEGGPAALRLGMDEVRLFLLALLYIVLFYVALFVMGIIFAIMAGGIVGRDNMASGLLLFVAVVAIFCAFFYVKLSLGFPLTLIRGRFAIGEAWNLTSGRFWTLFAAYLIIFLIMLGLSLLIGLATQQEYFAALFEGGFNSERTQQAALREYRQLRSGGVDATILLDWVASAVLGALGVALWGGAAATAALELTGDQQGLAETFS